MREINILLDEIEILIEQNKELDYRDKNYYLGLIRAIKLLTINKK